ncbi:MAG: TetR/AcrR family transcriptional regulator [Salinivirgaceae bacterium]|jgi:AcrR family transcriptional regulator|nr:TetR/AcrR family transcriptional regulator [Salinivirgaceae bacterium]
MVVSKDDKVKNEILIKAQGLFQIYGLKKTTMDEIAAACGKAKSTLYHYFKSKDEVFDAVINLEITSLRKAVKVNVDQKTNLTDKILAYFVTFHEEAFQRINLYRVVKQEIKIEAIGQLHFNKLFEFEKEYISRILEDGFDSGEYTEFAKDDIGWLSKTLIAAFLGIVRYMVESDEGIDTVKLKKAANMIIPKIFT